MASTKGLWIDCSTRSREPAEQTQIAAEQFDRRERRHPVCDTVGDLADELRVHEVVRGTGPRDLGHVAARVADPLAALVDAALQVERRLPFCFRPSGALDAMADNRRRSDTRLLFGGALLMLLAAWLFK